MSKFGLKIGEETVYNISDPDKAIELIKSVISQYFGEYWTQHKPRCPLCNEALSDTEKYMNRPVGECTNPKCNSTIHIADFFGKMKDILDEWDESKEGWLENIKKQIQEKIKEEETTKKYAKKPDTTFPDKSSQHDRQETQDGVVIFKW